MDSKRASLARLGEEIAKVAAHIDAATHRLLTKIRAFDEAGGWHMQGAVSCAHWLSWRIGLSAGAAREKVRVARALARLPRIDAALASGALSFSKVRAMTRVATPENEAALLAQAQHATGAQLEKICRLYRGVTGQAAEAGDDDRRWVTARATDDGMVRITAVVTPEESARIMKAVESAGRDVSAERLSRPDGLVDVAESYLRGSAPDRAPVEVVVTAPRQALAGGSGEHGVVEERAVPAETLRRLACDAGVVEVATDDGGTPLDIGRKRRTISPALRRALRLRDGGCAFPGCDNDRFVDGHHIEHWTDGGETRLGNLLLLCRRHHILVHEGGFSIAWDSGAVVARDPDGCILPRTGRRPLTSPDALARECAARGLAIAPATNLPGWDGRSPDLDACVGVLLARDAAANRSRGS